jgi:hypothetical protein
MPTKSSAEVLTVTNFDDGYDLPVGPALTLTRLDDLRTLETRGSSYPLVACTCGMHVSALPNFQYYALLFLFYPYLFHKWHPDDPTCGLHGPISDTGAETFSSVIFCC